MRRDRSRRWALAVGLATALSAASAGGARADFPYVGDGTAGQPSTYHKNPGSGQPNDFGDDFRFATSPESSPQSIADNNGKLSELCGLRGGAVTDNNASFPLTDFPPTSACFGDYGGKNVRTGWAQTTGRPDVPIAVLDSGIKWNDTGAMNDLRKKVRLNTGELPYPEVDPTPTDATLLPTGQTCANYTSGAYDANGDGVVNLSDYACDNRISLTNPDRHGPAATMTPEDLILRFGNCQINSDRSLGTCAAGTHYDNDHNGYANDIAGWDFVANKNNPYDDVQYGHGSGEAQDSNAEANNGNKVGTCPNCMVMPLRVGESFIADVNRFAQAAVYATDQGAYVVQEALGTLNNSNLAREAIEYAYQHGTTVVASAADEAAEHHNQPGVLSDTVLVNSVTNYDLSATPGSQSYLQFNGCTNFSTKITVAVESSSCSSDATGKSSGIVGLIYSAALNARDAGTLQPSDDCRRVNGQRCVITANEVRQLMASGNINSSTSADQGGGPTDGDTYTGTGDTNHGQADDVNFAQQPEPSCAAPTPTCTDPNHNMLFSSEQNGGTSAGPDTRRYPARKGFDEFYGYGRLNAFNAVWAAAQGKIPPEAGITSPDWFERIDPNQSQIDIQGQVYARGSSYTCTLEVAAGGQPNNAPASGGGDFHSVSSSFCDGSTAHTDPYSGSLGHLDVTTLKSYFPPTNTGNFDGREPGLAGAQTSNGRPSTMPYAFTVRVVVRTAGANPMSGMDRRQFFLHRDADTLNQNWPKDLHTDGASSPVLADIDGDNRSELVVATSDGLVHAYRSDGSEVSGWPVHTRALSLHNEVAYSTAGGPISAPRYGAILGSLAAGDLFHDGRIEILADDLEGNVYAWDSSGHEVFHTTSNPAYSGNPTTVPGHDEYQSIRTGHMTRTDHGFAMAPVLAHLDGNPHGPLDIVAAGLDRHLYAWHADGTPVPGFPVLVVDPSKVTAVDPTTHLVTFNPGLDDGLTADQGKLVDTPAVADIDGSGKPEIVVGSNEEYDRSNDGFNAGAFDTASLQPLAAGGGSIGLHFGNSRLYAIKPTGLPSGESPSTVTQIHDAFLANWPFKVGLIDRGLLPDVGEGVTGSPVVGPVACPSGPDVGQTAPKVGVIPDAGPGYILNRDATSCYGNDGSGDIALQTDFAAGTTKYDTPAIPAVGDPAFGNVGGQVTFMAPATGLVRALDVVANEYQGGQDFLAAWNPSSGQFMPGWPTPVNDLQFLTGPSTGAIDQTSLNESPLEGSASQDLAAFGPTGAPAGPNWPKLTGDWTVANPTLGSFGTLDTEAGKPKDVVSITRYGSLTVYKTPASACSPSSWPRYHHDLANSGDYSRDAFPPGKPMNAAISGAQLTFTAPGNDLMCGTADHYQAATSDSPITPQSFASALPIQSLPAPHAAGSAESITLPTGTLRYVAVRAVDGQGNLGLPAVVDRGTSTPLGGGSGPGGASGSGSGGTSGPTFGGLGPGGASGPPCLATAPRSKLSHRLGRHARPTLRGTSVDVGCSRSAVRGVQVLVARLLRHRRCQFVTTGGRLTRPRSCQRPVYLTARVRARRDGSVTWSLPLRRRLPHGRYEALTRAYDAQGHFESRALRSSRLFFRVR